MTRRIAIIALAALVATTGYAADDELQKVEKGWAAAVAARDFAALGRILGDDLIYAHSTGLIETKAEYLAKLREGSQRYNGIEYSSMTVRNLGSSAVVHSVVRMHGTTKGEPFDNKLMMMHVWAKQGAGWRLVAHQTTRLP
jgi:ketosteroid isomerase-like protein